MDVCPHLELKIAVDTTKTPQMIGAARQVMSPEVRARMGIRESRAERRAIADPDPMQIQLRQLLGKHYGRYQESGLPLHLDRGRHIEETMRRREQAFSPPGVKLGNLIGKLAANLVHKRRQLGKDALRDQGDLLKIDKRDRKLTGDPLAALPHLQSDLD